MAKSKLVTGLFKNRVAAEAAVDAILKRGYTRDDISVLMSDATRTKEFAVQARTHAADGAGIGGALGGAVGAVLAAIAAVGSTIFLPGINLVIAALRLLWFNLAVRETERVRQARVQQHDASSAPRPS